MKFALLSDLHLECSQYKGTFPDADVLLLAGDIASLDFKTIEKEGAFLRRCYEKYDEENVIQIEGNHEQYNGEWAALNHDKIVKEYPEENVVVIACTLWSGEESQMAYKFINDQRLIDGFTWLKMFEEHKRCVDFIVDKLEEYKDWKTVVMTHHMPHLKCVDERWLEPADRFFINYAFFTDLEWLIKRYSPDVWCHGHTHSSVDTMVHNTRIICNPRGYTSYVVAENKDFDQMKTFEV